MTRHVTALAIAAATVSIFVSTTCFKYRPKKKVGMEATLDHFQQCPEVEDAIIIPNVTINRGESGEQFFSGTVDILDTVLRPTMHISVQLHKQNGYEEIMKLDYEDFCETMADENKPWKGVFGKTLNSTTCPVQQGNYTIPNTTFQPEKVMSGNLLGIKNYIVKIETVFKNQDVKIGCFWINFHVNHV